MEKLPEKYRTVLWFHFKEGMTVEQTAHALGLKTATVKQRLVRGKKTLLDMFESEKEKS